MSASTSAATVEPSPPSTASSVNRLAHRITPLDGLRGVFALVVTIYHLEGLLLYQSYTFVGGWIGVDGFFVLSGFLITSLLVDEQRRTGAIHYFRFLGRRLLRLWPALIVVLAVSVLLARLVSHLGWSAIGSSTIASALFLLNWTHHLKWVSNSWLGHLWSLSPEFQFYLTVPLLLMALQKLRVPRWGWIAVVATLAVGSAVWRCLEVQRTGAVYNAYVDTHLRADSFLVGSLVALLTTWGWLGERWRWPLRVGAVAGIAFLAWIVSSVEFGYRWLYVDFGLAACALAVAAIIAHLVIEPRSLISRFFAHDTLVAVGRRSYSLYLWHFPIIVYALKVLNRWPDVWQVAFVVVVLAVATELSYQFVERPGMRLGQRYLSGTGPRRPDPTDGAAGPPDAAEPAAAGR